MDPNFGFNTPALGPTTKPGAGLSSARLLRRKKPTPAPQSRPAPLRNDPGFNPFRPDLGTGSGPGLGKLDPSNLNSDAFVFGAQKINDQSSGSNQSSLSSLNLDNYMEQNAVADELRKLKIKNERSANLSANLGANLGASVGKNGGGIGESVDIDLPDEMSHLNIESKGNMRSFDVELQDEIKKLNIDGHIDNEPEKLSETMLRNKMENLNVESSVASYGTTCENERVDVSSSEASASSFPLGSGGKDDGVLHRTEELRTGTGYGKFSSQMENSMPPFREKFKKVQGQNFDGPNLQNASVTIPSVFSTLAGAQSESLSGTHIHFDDQSSSTSSSSFTASGIHFKGPKNVFEARSRDRAEKKVQFSFISKWDDGGTQNIEFKTPNIKGNFNRKPEMIRESAKGTRSKKKKGKLKKPVQVQLSSGTSVPDFACEENLQENDDSYEPYSPMDISPYQETLADNIFSRETSVASDEPFGFDDNTTSVDSCPELSNGAKDEDLNDLTENLVVNEGEKYEEIKEEIPAYFSDKGVNAECPLEESISGAETESFQSATDQLDYTVDSFITAADTLFTSSDTEVSSSSIIGRQDGDSHFNCPPTQEEIGQSNFIFGASSGSQSQSSTTTRQYKKKDRTKVGYDSYCSTQSIKDSYTSFRSDFVPFSGTSTLLSPRQGQKGDVTTLLNKSGNNADLVKQQEAEQETSSGLAANFAAQEACEKWRLRGNQAYANGDLCKADDFYSQGVNSVSENETSRSCLRAVMLCYSNRAATRMSLGRIKEALEDCMKAAALDPNFLRVQVRAANCYLALGEVENASLHFMKCLQPGTDVCVDRKLIVEASEGLEKAQKLSEYMKQSVELLQRGTLLDTERALSSVEEALIISPYSEKLFEKKADALLMLQKYEEVIQLCGRNLSTSMSKFNDSDLQRGSIPLSWSLIIKAYFYMGRLEEALDFLKKQEELRALSEIRGSKTLESLIPLAGTMRELLRHKAAGNEAFQSGRHAEAVQHYTAAILCNVESRPFAAICFCNRAAAYRAMGQVIDAIADCSLAIALDGNYLKAFSRRAALFEMIRDYGQAALDLQRLVSLLTKKLEDKNNQPVPPDRVNHANELKQTHVKLSQMEEAARKEISLNIYLILGVDQSAEASEIKKAYRRAALKHHPDKAGQLLARSENGDDALWKGIAEEVHKDADRLFKMIGEAYAVLSDPSKRSQYDLEEEMRNAQNRGGGRSASNTHADFQNYSYERSSGRWQEGWRQYRSSQPKPYERSRSNWYS